MGGAFLPQFSRIIIFSLDSYYRDLSCSKSITKSFVIYPDEPKNAGNCMKCIDPPSKKFPCLGGGFSASWSKDYGNHRVFLFVGRGDFSAQLSDIKNIFFYFRTRYITILAYFFIGPNLCNDPIIHLFTDLDECSTNEKSWKHLCDYKCVNTQGSYQCECPDGYYLGQDGTNCQSN